MVFEHTKRPFSDDEQCHLGYKHQRQLDYNSQITTFVEIVPCNNSTQKICFPAGETEERFPKSLQDKNPSPTTHEPSVTFNQQLANVGTSVISGSDSENDSWFPITYREDDGTSDSAVQVSCSLVLREYQRDIYSSLIGCSPRKPIPIGPDHQADIPLCCPPGTTSCFSHMGMLTLTMGAGSCNEEDMTRFQGTYVIPMTDADSCADENVKPGLGRIDCGCLDHGSIRCVQQHIMEEKEQLKIQLGEERFIQLGFCEMGEEVAKKWSAEDEQVFHEVVFSNPASLSRNFWNQLSLVFPSRTKKELVSYYFNVFVLRRRAGQNRWDPFHVDSDDDEWQLSDEEPAVTEEDEDEDSVVDDLDGIDGNPDGIFNDGENHEDDNDDDDGDDDDEGFDVHGEDSKSLDRNCNLNLDFKLRENAWNSTEDQDVQDDSCMSYEGHHNSDDQRCNPADDAGKQQGLVEREDKHPNSEYLNDSSCGMDAHGYAMEPCDPKVWDIGYLTGPLKDIDFLPTSNVIKEVLGEEAWNTETMRDGPGIS